MECSCIYSDVDQFVTIIKKSYIKSARKEHQCSECGNTIAIGKPYESHFYTFDGDTSLHKFCEDCQSLRETFFCDGYNYGEIIERTVEHISEMEGNISSECINDLSDGARNFVLKEIQEIYDDLNDCED